MEKLIFEVHIPGAINQKALFYADARGDLSVVFSRHGRKQVRSRPAPWEVVKPFLMYLRPKTTDEELAAIEAMIR